MRPSYNRLFITTNFVTIIFALNSVLFALSDNRGATFLNLVGVMLCISLAVFLYRKVLCENEKLT
ncbi:hypothetical protein WAK64_06135 [Bacillus spongiae]|uniref:Uncharacterized protein n=1 Tax=Bacillus spongiae TaxID=2683610 RepID=A0ABU8HBX4_9BACI